jgi:hypothetical protein
LRKNVEFLVQRQCAERPSADCGWTPNFTISNSLNINFFSTYLPWPNLTSGPIRPWLIT